MVGVIITTCALVGLIFYIKKVTKANREKMAKEIEDSL